MIIAGLRLEDLGMAAFMLSILAFLVFCVVIGRRRWATVETTNSHSLRMATEAVSDRKRILVVLEEIKTLLQDRKN